MRRDVIFNQLLRLSDLEDDLDEMLFVG